MIVEKYGYNTRSGLFHWGPAKIRLIFYQEPKRWTNIWLEIVQILPQRLRVSGGLRTAHMIKASTRVWPESGLSLFLSLFPCPDFSAVLVLCLLLNTGDLAVKLVSEAEGLIHARIVSSALYWVGCSYVGSTSELLRDFYLCIYLFYFFLGGVVFLVSASFPWTGTDYIPVTF